MPRTKKKEAMEDLYETELLAGLKSSTAYKTEWNKFLQHNKITGRKQPREEHVVSYLTHLREERSYKASSLWSCYCKLNFMFKTEFDFSLKEYHRIGLLLKTWGSDESTKKSKTFSKGEVEMFLKMSELSDCYWCVRKAYVAVCFLSGMRCTEALMLEMTNYQESPVGYLFTYQHCAKVKKADMERGRFVVPRDSIYFCVVEEYLNRRSPVSQEGRFFITGTKTTADRTTTGTFRVQPLGINKMYGIPAEVARVLALDGSYTGHSFRRSSATQAAEAGASIVQMQRHYGWVSQAMPQRYTEVTQAGQVAMSQLLTQNNSPPTQTPQEVKININVQQNKP